MCKAVVSVTPHSLQNVQVAKNCVADGGETVHLIPGAEHLLFPCSAVRQCARVFIRLRDLDKGADLNLTAGGVSEL